MKTDKANLRLNGETLLERTVRVCQLAFPAARLTICGRPHHPSGIGDDVNHLGPIGGLASFANQVLLQEPFVEGRFLMLVPVDLPRLTSRALRFLADESLKWQSDMTIVDSHLLPVVFKISTEFFDVLQHIVDLGDAERSLKTLATMLRCRSLLADDSLTCALQNANTPEQWCQIVDDNERNFTA